MSLRNASAAKVDIVDALGSAVKVRKNRVLSLTNFFAIKTSKSNFRIGDPSGSTVKFAVFYEFNSGDVK